MNFNTTGTADNNSPNIPTPTPTNSPNTPGTAVATVAGHSRRPTYPISLAAIKPGAINTRFHLADSLLRKRNIRPNSQTQTRTAANAHNLAFSAGITIPARLDIGQQQAAPYTINGKRNLWTDYLPSAHFRAYYSDNWDLQVDVSTLQPQYTGTRVIDSTGGDSSNIAPFQGYRQYNVYTAKKLFYSEASVIIHRQLYKGIWLGAGVTYGHLQGAVGDRQMLMKATNPGVSDTILNSEVVSIKSNDTAYNRISRSDWRILLGAEYKWRRVTIGLRYERALNSWLPLQANGSRGSQNNSSFTLRGSFELWQRRR